MNTQDIIHAIISRIDAVHQSQADGCKASCRTAEVGYYESRNGYDENYWFARFGGYCIGNLHRWEEVKAPSLEELHDKVCALLLREVITQ